MLKTVKVPEDFEPLFQKAQDYVEEYFGNRKEDPSRGTIEISGQRYILVRAASLSVDFFEIAASLYEREGKEEANNIARQLLFDIAHAIGRQDARNFHKKMHVHDPMEKLSAGPIHFAYTGWASVDVFPDSQMSPDDNYYVIYDLSCSFESAAWLAAGKKPEFPVCVMGAGYSSGWCEESVGVALVATEIMCRAKGDDACRFVMAPPHRMEGHIAAYLKKEPELAKRISRYEVPGFFKRKEAEAALCESEDRFRVIFDGATDGILLADVDSKQLLLGNATICRMLGYSLDEIKELHVTDIHPDSERENILSGFARRASGETTAAQSRPMKRKDGSIFDAEITSTHLNICGKTCLAGFFRDVTERKRGEDRLTLFRALIDRSSDAIIVLDPFVLRFLDVNETACRDFGYSRDEFLSMSLWDIDPSVTPDFTEKVAHQLQESGKVRFERMVRRKDGSMFPVEVSLSFVKLDGSYNVAILRDITERRQAEEEIRGQRKLISQIIETIPLRVFWKDRESRYLGCNTLFAKDAGLSRPDELTGKNDFDMGWRDQAELYRADDRLVMDSRISKLSYDEPQTTPDGGRIWLRTSKVPLLNEANEVFGMLGVYEDITAYKGTELRLRESEERFRLAFQNSAIGMTLTGLDNRWIMVNDAFCRILGYPEQELLGKTYIELTYPEDLPISLDYARRVAAGEIATYQLEKRYVHKDGHIIWIRLTVSLVRDAQGEPLYYVCQFEDITEQNLARERIRRLNEELEVKVQERTKQLLDMQEELVRKEKLAVLGQVAGSVGHELRNPLGVISNAVYFLETTLSDADEITKEYLNIIKEEIAGSDRIVSDLLDAVRTKPPQTALVGLQELIGQTLQKYAVPSAVTVKLDIPRSLPPLRVDAMQIQQVFRNLISNGVEAMREGGTLEIRAVENEPDKTVTVSVSDTGAGIAPEVMKKLFQPLFTTKARGIGLGLVVVKNLTQANGGSVTVESIPGKGSTFSVTLPTGS